jgi:hypothetical protein
LRKDAVAANALNLLRNGGDGAATAQEEVVAFTWPLGIAASCALVMVISSVWSSGRLGRTLYSGTRSALHAIAVSEGKRTAMRCMIHGTEMRLKRYGAGGKLRTILS